MGIPCKDKDAGIAMKHFPIVRLALALLFVLSGVLTCFANDQRLKFFLIQAILVLLALWRVFAPFPAAKKNQRRDRHNDIHRAS